MKEHLSVLESEIGELTSTTLTNYLCNWMNTHDRAPRLDASDVVEKALAKWAYCRCEKCGDEVRIEEKKHHR